MINPLFQPTIQLRKKGNMELTKNFKLSEFLKSETADKEGYTEQYTPAQEVIDNLKELCVHVLQPLRDNLTNGIIITSGYRCERLNNDPAIKGAKNSQHMTGEAADICYFVNGDNLNSRIYDLITSMGIEFDQVIKEKGTPDKPDWIHISYRRGNNRKQKFSIV